MKRGSMWTQLLRSAGCWGAVVLAAFYLNFLAVHLATEMHFHRGEEHHHASGHDDAHDHDHDHGQEHDAGEHVPHAAADHLLDVALKGTDPVVAGSAQAVISETFFFDAPTRFTWTRHVFERERPPGVSPPDPQQSRAPPLA